MEMLNERSRRFSRGWTVALQTGPIFSHRSPSRDTVEYIRVQRTRRHERPSLSKSSGARAAAMCKTTNSDALVCDFYLSRPMRIDRHELMRHYIPRCHVQPRKQHRSRWSVGDDCAETLYRFTGYTLQRIVSPLVNKFESGSNFWSPFFFRFFFLSLSFFFVCLFVPCAQVDLRVSGLFVYKI